MRLRFKGAAPVQLPTPFGYLVSPGDVVEVADNLVHVLRQPNVSNMFSVTEQGVFRMPPFDDWEDAGVPEQQVEQVEAEPEERPFEEPAPADDAEQPAPSRPRRPRR